MTAPEERPLEPGELFLELWRAIPSEREKGWLEILFQALHHHFELSRLDCLYGYGFFVGKLKAHYLDDCWTHGPQKACEIAIRRVRRYFDEIVA